MNTPQEVIGLTVRQWADTEGVTPGRVRQWITEGRLPVIGTDPYRISPETRPPAAQKRGPKGPRPPKKPRKARGKRNSRKSSQNQ
jgi:hypothetical protein